MTETEVLIVGAGPIGLELAVALKQLKVNYVHLEAAQIGQTISWFPKQVRFFSSPERIAIAGVPLQTADQSKALREEYLAYLRGICQQFDLTVNTQERVTEIHPDPTDAQRGLIIRSRHRGADRRYLARHTILAIGDMHRPRPLAIPGEDLKHVSHYFDEPHRYFRQRLFIVGGKNSAVEAALRCHRAGAQVSMSYRRECFDPKSIKYWLLPEIKVLIKTGQIDFHPCTVPVRITPDHVTLQSVGDDGVSGAITPNQRVRADFVLLLVGYEMDRSLLKMAGVNLLGVNQAPQVEERTMETNVPGLYVAGTAAAGTQVKFKLFIENTHEHVQRIVRAVTGRNPLFDAANKTNRALSLQRQALPES